MGYGFGNLPKAVTFRATLIILTPAIKELSSEDIPGINGVSESGMLVGNIGFGIAF